MRIYAILLIFFLVSCGEKPMIPKDDFVSILTDINLSKMYYTNEGMVYPFWQDTIPYNRHIVERHGYTWTQFDSTVSWYCTQPQKYQEVYDDVLAELQKIEGTILAEPDPPVNLWDGKKFKELPFDGPQDSVPINFALHGLGTYTVSAKIKVYPQDQSINPHIVFYAWGSDSTTLGIRDTLYVMPLYNDGLWVNYSFSKMISDSAFTHLKGNWLAHSPDYMDSTWIKQASVKDISIYYTPFQENTVSN